MSVLATIGAALGLGKTLGSAVEGVASAIDNFVETPDEKRAAEIIIAKMKQDPARWQAQINKVEAAHKSLFVAGWRPAIGWTCAIGLAYGWVIQPVMVAVLTFVGRTIELPQMPLASVVSLTLAMLGMAKIRSDDKKAGLTL